MRPWLLIATLALAACSRAPEPPAVTTAAQQPVAVAKPPTAVAEAPAAAGWLGAAREAHAFADQQQAGGDRQAAIAQLRAAMASEAPAPVSAADAAAVKRGLCAHAAQLALELGHTQDAEALIQEGLALPGSDPMRTQLLLLRVEIARQRGDKNAEARARKEAQEDLALPPP